MGRLTQSYYIFSFLLGTYAVFHGSSFDRQSDKFLKSSHQTFHAAWFISDPDGDDQRLARRFQAGFMLNLKSYPFKFNCILLKLCILSYHNKDQVELLLIFSSFFTAIINLASWSSSPSLDLLFLLGLQVVLYSNPYIFCNLLYVPLFIIS